MRATAALAAEGGRNPVASAGGRLPRSMAALPLRPNRPRPLLRLLLRRRLLPPSLVGLLLASALICSMPNPACTTGTLGSGAVPEAGGGGAAA